MFISVAFCTYNGEKFLRKQLDSILVQSQSVNEIIICDDLSSDSTIEILKEYKDNFPQVIKLFSNSNSLGTIKNFEKAISLTKGDLLFLADQDDIWHKDKVEIMVNFFKENNNCKLLFTDGDLIDENGDSLNTTLWEKWNFSTDMQNKWTNNKNAFKDLVVNNNKITGATICFHKSLKDVILPIEVPYGYWHDAWLGIHASAVDGLMFIEKSLIDYRIHLGQQVGVSSSIKSEIIEKSNQKVIDRFVFYKRIASKYPGLKSYLPNNKAKNTFFKKLKKFYCKLCQTR